MRALLQPEPYTPEATEEDETDHGNEYGLGCT
jgi:hypothetical protein